MGETMRKFVRQPSPAMVVAVIALTVAMSTTAGALPGRNTVSKDDIRKNAVGSSEILTNGVASSELREDSVGKSELREEGDPDGGLTGAHISESSLDKVPSAASADSATTATSATTADSAKLASDLAPPEAYREVGSPGNPDFQNGCTNIGGMSETAAFFKDRQGIVHLRGRVTCTGAGLDAFQLPAGYRPANGKIHTELTVVEAAPDGDGPVLVLGTGFGADGGVRAPNASGEFVIDGIQFRAES
jgi:hypothetical protein